MCISSLQNFCVIMLFTTLHLCRLDFFQALTRLALIVLELVACAHHYQTYYTELLQITMFSYNRHHAFFHISMLYRLNLVCAWPCGQKHLVTCNQQIWTCIQMQFPSTHLHAVVGHAQNKRSGINVLKMTSHNTTIWWCTGPELFWKQEMLILDFIYQW